jgi:hypothetical protein
MRRTGSSAGVPAADTTRYSIEVNAGYFNLRAWRAPLGRRFTLTPPGFLLPNAIALKRNHASLSKFGEPRASYEGLVFHSFCWTGHCLKGRSLGLGFLLGVFGGSGNGLQICVGPGEVTSSGNGLAGSSLGGVFILGHLLCFICLRVYRAYPTRGMYVPCCSESLNLDF